MSTKNSRFGFGLVFGALAGAVAGLFLAPKAGKELRDDAKALSKKIYADLKDKEVDVAVKEIFGKVTDESREMYATAKTELAEQLSMLGENYKKIDKNKYVGIVKSVVKHVQDEHNLPGDELKALGKHLESDFKKLIPTAQSAKKPLKRKSTPEPSKKSTFQKKTLIAKK